jgi:hypothetical protein
MEDQHVENKNITTRSDTKFCRVQIGYDLCLSRWNGPRFVTTQGDLHWSSISIGCVQM